jgi:hypothetical protein
MASPATAGASRHPCAIERTPALQKKRSRGPCRAPAGTDRRSRFAPAAAPLQPHAARHCEHPCARRRLCRRGRKADRPADSVAGDKDERKRFPSRLLPACQVRSRPTWRQQATRPQSTSGPSRFGSFPAGNAVAINAKYCSVLHALTAMLMPLPPGRSGDFPRGGSDEGSPEGAKRVPEGMSARHFLETGSSAAPHDGVKTAICSHVLWGDGSTVDRPSTAVPVRKVDPCP